MQAECSSRTLGGLHDVTRVRTRGASNTGCCSKGAPAMHGPEYSTSFTRILAIDLGKFNSVVCAYEPITHRPPAFESVQTTPQMMHDLFVRGVSLDADRG